MEDPTGVVYRIHSEGPDYLNAQGHAEQKGFIRNWYRGLEKKSYSVSRTKVEKEIFGWHTSDWGAWFKANDQPLTKLHVAAREATLAGTFQHSEDFFNRLTIFVGDVKWTIAEGAVLQAGYAFSFFRAVQMASAAGTAIRVGRGSADLAAARAHVQGRTAEIRRVLGRAHDFGETYAVGAVRAKNGTIKYYVASKSPHGVARINSSLRAGEELVGHGVKSDLHAEMLVQRIAESRGETLLGIGATRPMCKTYKGVRWCQDYFDTIGVPVWTARK